MIDKHSVESECNDDTLDIGVNVDGELVECRVETLEIF